MDRSEKLTKIVQFYGTDNQIKKAIEELTELSLELQRNLSNPGSNTLKVIEELADVQIMVDQMRMIFTQCSVPCLFYDFESVKLDRQLERMEAEAVKA